MKCVSRVCGSQRGRIARVVFNRRSRYRIQLLNMRVPFFGILNVCNMGGKKKITPLFFCIFLFSFFFFFRDIDSGLLRRKENRIPIRIIFFFFLEFIFFSFKKFPSFSTNLYGCGKKKKEKKKKRSIRGKRK